MIKKSYNSLLKTKINLNTILFLLALIIIVFPLFYKLGSTTLQLWDESRLAVSAMEMYYNHNFITPHFNGLPDMWNTKPPFVIWLQVISLKIFGMNEFSVRFPSALFACFTVLFVIYFCLKYFDLKYWGLTSAFMLTTSVGYMYVHIARSGDYDSVLVFCTTVFILLMFLFINMSYPKWRHLYLATFIMLIAIFTKGIQGAIFIPVVMLFLIYNKRFFMVIKNYRFLLLVVISVLLIICYYLLRESNSADYINSTYINEIDRFFLVIQGHEGGMFYYLDNLTYRFFPWIIFIPISLVVANTSICLIPKKTKDFINYLSITSLFYLIIISFSSTKLEWYDASLFPLLSIISSFSICYFFSYVKTISKKKELSFIKKNTLRIVVIIIFMLFASTYRWIVLRIHHQEEIQYTSGYYMKKFQSLRKFTYIDNNYSDAIGANPHVLFYKKILKAKDVNVRITHLDSLKSGETVMICNRNIYNEVSAKYSYHLKDSLQSFYLIKID